MNGKHPHRREAILKWTDPTLKKPALEMSPEALSTPKLNRILLEAWYLD